MVCLLMMAMGVKATAVEGQSSRLPQVEYRVSGATRRRHGNGFLQLLQNSSSCNSSYRYCPCCGMCVPEWNIVSTRIGTHHGHALGLDERPAQCPRCRTRERHRFNCLAWALESASASSRPTVAYFGPQRSHARRLERFLSLKLIRYDLFDPAYAKAYENTTIRADVQAIPRENASINAMIILHVLEHVPDLRKAVSEIARVLTPGGFVDAETPCFSRSFNSPPAFTCAGTNTNESSVSKKRKRRSPRRIILSPYNLTAPADDWICDQPDHLFSYSCWHLKDTFESAGLRCDCLHLDPHETERFIGALSFDDMRLRCHKPPRNSRSAATSSASSFGADFVSLRHARHRLSYTTRTEVSSSSSLCLNLSSAPILTRLRSSRRTV